MTELGGAAAAWLVTAGVLSGAASIAAFALWTDTAKLRTAVNRILAHLLEFRLFAEEPRLILRAQANLLRANASLLRALLGPSVLLMIPFALLLAVLEGFFGHVALRAGEAAVVTMRGLGNWQLRAPSGVAVESPAVRALRIQEVSWRIRPARAVTGKLEVSGSGRMWQKTMHAGQGIHWIAPDNPFSSRLQVHYPEAWVYGQHWWVWYSAAAFIGALLGGWRTWRV